MNNIQDYSVLYDNARQYVRFGILFTCGKHFHDRDKVYQLLAHGRWFSPGTP
jgi:hypothetical protein